jgi:hypothetical protein
MPYGRGRGFSRTLNANTGRGLYCRGIGKGLGRGYGFENAVVEITAEEEIRILENEALLLKKNIDGVNSRINELKEISRQDKN